ncbi:MAG TPA: glycosyltransferase family 2 protein [Usitatibacter sp.]|jgi:GT2 family glycosyltransferase|nr:glycosyltransferase family 2 protein [Usitatibacter sp.]
MPPIDVIVPVYGGLAATRRCLDSVLANPQRAQHEVVVVDDRGPEPGIAPYLDDLAAAGRITLLRNERNLGFVQSVNRGMSLHPGRDVVLLNSDTEVGNDWLDRLAATAHSAPDIATATPFSNNATICSYPFHGWTGGVPGKLGLAALDAVFAATLPGYTVDIPTAVGFCMYIRRDALERVGLFDAERYGRGYGEENDFCMRALKSGWRHVLAADVFVFHEGNVSFGPEKLELTQRATQVLCEAHPDYPQRVHEFIARDPARALRDAIDAARIRRDGREAAEVAAERARENPRAGLALAVGTMSRGAVLRLLRLALRPRAGRALRERFGQLVREEGWGGIARRLRRVA